MRPQLWAQVYAYTRASFHPPIGEAVAGYADRVETDRIIYIGDPMCSWCWGIAPELDRLQAWTTLPFDVVVGGLRPGPSAERMRPSMLDGRPPVILEITWAIELGPEKNAVCPAAISNCEKL